MAQQASWARRSIGAAGSGLGSLMYSLATQTVIEKLGLNWAFRIIAICALQPIWFAPS